MHVITFPQLRLLHSLVASHYSLPELAKLLSIDEVRKDTELYDAMRKTMEILLTTEGQQHWDEYIARKKGYPGTKRRLDKKLKIKQHRESFPRISDEAVTDEIVIEFAIEHERLKSEAGRKDISSTDSLPDSPSVHI